MPSGVPQIQVAPAAKPWHASRTLWFNAAVLALALLETRLEVLQPLLPVNVYALIAVLLPIGNAVLRLVTTTAVSVRTPPDAATTTNETPPSP